MANKFSQLGPFKEKAYFLFSHLSLLASDEIEGMKDRHQSASTQGLN